MIKARINDDGKFKDLFLTLNTEDQKVAGFVDRQTSLIEGGLIILHVIEISIRISIYIKIHPTDECRYTHLLLFHRSSEYKRQFTVRFPA